MTEYAAKRSAVRPPTSPGELLRDDVLPSLGRSKVEIAKLLGISRQSLYDILSERQPVTPQMALRLGKLIGNGPDLWLNMQRARDLWFAEKEMKKELSSIQKLKAVA